VLDMRAGCERCDTDLPPDSADARICSFECTFCVRCAEGPLAGGCPNCGGDLRPRPTRAPELLGRHPASTERVFNPPAAVDRDA
jgi:hypothetical protein